MVVPISSNEWQAIGKLAKPSKYITSGYSFLFKDRWVLITDISEIWIPGVKGPGDFVKHVVVKFLNEDKERQIHFEDPRQLHSMFEIKWS